MQEGSLPPPQNPIAEQTAFKLQALLGLPASHVRFESPQLVYYLASYTLHLIEFADDFDEPTFYKFELPNVELINSLTVDTIRVVTLTRQDRILVVAIASDLYAWDVRTGTMLWRIDVAKGDRVVALGRPLVVDGVGWIGCVRADATGQLIEIRWMDRLEMPKVIHLAQAPSLLKNLLSFWAKPQDKNYGFTKCVLIKGNRDKAECILLKDSIAQKYSIGIEGDNRRVKLDGSFNLREIHQLESHNFVNIFVELENKMGPSQRLLFTVVSVAPNQVTYLTRFTRTLSLSALLNSSFESVVACKRPLSQLAYSIVMDKAYVIGQKDSNSYQIQFQRDRKLADTINCQQLRGRAVMVGRYKLTEGGILEIYGRGSEDFGISGRTSHVSENQYRATINTLQQTTPKLASAISIYTDKYSDPIDMLDALRDKNNELKTYLNQLIQQKKVSYIPEVLSEHLNIETQILMAENLKKLHRVISQVASDRYRTNPMKLFETTSWLPEMLAGIAGSNQWQVYIQILKLVIQFKNRHLQYYSMIEPRVLDTFLFPLNRLIQNQQIIFQQDRAPAIELYSLAIELNPNQNIYYVQLVRTGDFDTCIEIALRHSHYEIVPTLYSITDNILPHQIDTMLKDADITEKTRIVCQTALSFFRVLAQSQFDNPVSGLKIFRDFPEYDKNIYEVIKNQYPQFAWLLAMKLRKPLLQEKGLLIQIQNQSRSDRNRHVLAKIIQIADRMNLASRPNVF